MRNQASEAFRWKRSINKSYHWSKLLCCSDVPSREKENLLCGCWELFLLLFADNSSHCIGDQPPRPSWTGASFVSPFTTISGLSKGQTFCKIFTAFVFLVVSLSFYLLFPYTDCKWRKRSNMFSPANITADRRANRNSLQSWLVNDKPSLGAILVQKCFINKQYHCALYAFCICLCLPCTAVWGLQQSLLQCWAWLSCERTAQCSRNPQQKWTAHSVNGNQLQNLLFGKIIKINNRPANVERTARGRHLI